MSWLSKVFELNPAGLNWPGATMILDVLLVPLVVFRAIGYEQYLLSAVFGVLFSALADPGAGYRQRAFRIFVFGAIGAGLIALWFGIGRDAWGRLVLAAFAVTLAACPRAGTDAYPAKLECRWPNAAGKGVWFWTW